MSREAIERFISLLDTDEDLQQTYWQEVGRATLDAVVALAQRQNCEFTAEELAEVWAGEEGELDDDALDAVAGGQTTALVDGASPTAYGGSNIASTFLKAVSSKRLDFLALTRT
jgi:predicted ribosomally synthesized peptide with nif11-like leader